MVAWRSGCVHSTVYLGRRLLQLLPNVWTAGRLAALPCRDRTWTSLPTTTAVSRRGGGGAGGDSVYNEHLHITATSRWNAAGVALALYCGGWTSASALPRTDDLYPRASPRLPSLATSLPARQTRRAAPLTLLRALRLRTSRVCCAQHCCITYPLYAPHCSLRIAPLRCYAAAA